MTDDEMDGMSMNMSVPDWLTPVSWVFIAVGVLSAAVVLYDIYGRRHRQPYRPMEWAWSISALYLGPLSVWAYHRRGALNRPSRAVHTRKVGDDLRGRTFAGSTPGGAAATIGHFIGVPLVVLSGLTIAGTDLWLMIIVIALLAVALLFAFEYFLLTSTTRAPAKRNARTALLTATATVLAFDIGMGGWMLLLHYGAFMPVPTDIRFVFLMQIGLILGTLTAYPVVRALLHRRQAVSA